MLLYHVVPVAATSSELSVDEILPTEFTPNNLTVATIAPNVTIHPDGPGAADATVTTANVMATNGVVHIVDGVLLPPTHLLEAHKPNIVELAQSVDDLSTLVTAVVAAAAAAIGTHSLISSVAARNSAVAS